MHFLKYKDRFIIPHERQMKQSYRTKGEFRFVLSTDSGIVIQDTGWFDNHFLDSGIRNVGYSNWSTGMRIGSSSAAVSNTQTALVAELAVAGTSLYSEANGGAPNYEIITTKKARFNAGVGTGTIREVGIYGAPYEVTPGELSFRTIVPIPITKLDEQILDVFWRSTVYPDLTERSGTFDWDGELYNFRTKPGYMHVGNNLTTWAYGEPGFPWPRGTGSTIDDGIEERNLGGSSVYFYGSNFELLEHTPGLKKWRWHWPLQTIDNYVQTVQFDWATCRTSQRDQGMKVLFERASDNAPLEVLTTEIAHLDVHCGWGRYP